MEALGRTKKSRNLPSTFISWIFTRETLKIALNGRNLTFLLPLITEHFGALYRWTLPQALTSRMEALLCRSGSFCWTVGQGEETTMLSPLNKYGHNND
jgi:hypothetical protein